MRKRPLRFGPGPRGDFTAPEDDHDEPRKRSLAVSNTHDALADLLIHLKCKPGWSFRLVSEDDALRLVIKVAGHDSSRPDQLIPFIVNHFFPVPETTYNRKTWRRWVFECCRGVENHELGEWFREGMERPFSPLHGPGENPYVVHEFRPESDLLTTQDGSMREKYK